MRRIGGQPGTLLRFHEGAFTREDAGIDTTILQLVACAPARGLERWLGTSWTTEIAMSLSSPRS